jgi:hypothetical protein
MSSMDLCSCSTLLINNLPRLPIPKSTYPCHSLGTVNVGRSQTDAMANRKERSRDSVVDIEG